MSMTVHGTSHGVNGSSSQLQKTGMDAFVFHVLFNSIIVMLRYWMESLITEYNEELYRSSSN